MSSSPPSSDGTGPSDRDAFDFAEAAETLVQLQAQLQEMESAQETAEEARELASALKQASNNVSSVGQQLRATTSKLADACQDLSQQPTVSPKALKKIAEEVNKLKKTVNAADLNNARPRPQRRSDDSSSGGYGWTIGVLVLLTVVIGLQIVIWRALPDAPQASPPPAEATSQSESSTEPEAPAVTSLDQIDVQVLNGVGESGLAARMRAYLEEQGISVVHVGNAPIGTFDETTIFVHKRAFGVAERLADRLELASEHVRPGPTTEAGPGLTLMIGGDYDALSAYASDSDP
jgi:uncharacterized protein YukE